jgi:serine/threonine protein kinase
MDLGSGNEDHAARMADRNEQPEHVPPSPPRSARRRRGMLGLLRTESDPDIPRGEPPKPELPHRVGPPAPDGAPRYELLEHLGSGAQATVYRAVDRTLTDEEDENAAAIAVAVKLFAAPINPDDRAHALDEPRLARKVRHPNVLEVSDAGFTSEGWVYMVAETVDAKSLLVWRRAQQRVGVRQAVMIARDAARGLAAVHAQGLVHCDVAPTNILVTDAGRVLVADFGCALREEGSAGSSGGGTPAFMPVEAWRDGVASQAADVAGLAGVLFWLLTDLFPNGQSEEEILDSADDPAPADRRRRDALGGRGIAPSLAEITLGPLQPDGPSITAEHFANALDAWLAAQRRRWRTSMVALALVAIVFGSFSYWWWDSQQMLEPLPALDEMSPEKLGAALQTAPDDERMLGILSFNGLGIAPRNKNPGVRSLLDERRSRVERLPPHSRVYLYSTAAAEAVVNDDISDAHRWLAQCESLDRELPRTLRADAVAPTRSRVRSLAAFVYSQERLDAERAWHPNLIERALLVDDLKRGLDQYGGRELACPTTVLLTERIQLIRQLSQ